MSAVVVLLQTLYFEWRWLSMFLDVRGWEVVLEVCVFLLYTSSSSAQQL
jgi:hypothetical protein